MEFLVISFAIIGVLFLIYQTITWLIFLLDQRIKFMLGELNDKVSDLRIKVLTMEMEKKRRGR